MPSLRANSRRRHPLRWLSAVTLLGLAPKCVVCLAAYFGVGAWLGIRLNSPELCGASASSGVATWSAWLTAAAITAIAGVVFRKLHQSSRGQ